jgi:hypothetical protein
VQSAYFLGILREAGAISLLSLYAGVELALPIGYAGCQGIEERILGKRDQGSHSWFLYAQLTVEKQKGIAMAPAHCSSEECSHVSERSDCRFVESEEFCRLLVGKNRLIRADDSSLDLRGLLDLETGVRYLIETRKLTTTAF